MLSAILGHMIRQTTQVPVQTNHLLHLVLSFLTCGAWLFVWPCVWAVNTMRKRTVQTWTTNDFTPVPPGLGCGQQFPQGPPPPRPQYVSSPLSAGEHRYDWVTPGHRWPEDAYPHTPYVPGPSLPQDEGGSGGNR